MRPLRFCVSGLLALLLCGCLEVEQHPAWVNGQYNGKPDNLPYQVNFHNDKLAWQAAITNRNYLQNEYLRTAPGRANP
jgi:hypothetical protein